MSVFVFFGQMLHSGVGGSSGSSVLNVFRNLHTVSHGGAPTCIPTKRAPVSPHPLQHPFFLVFLIKVILTGVRWHLIVVVTCISLIISNFEHLFMCCRRLYGFGVLCSFLIRLFVFLFLSCMRFLYILDINP